MVVPDPIVLILNDLSIAHHSLGIIIPDMPPKALGLRKLRKSVSLSVWAISTMPDTSPSMSPC